MSMKTLTRWFGIFALVLTLGLWGVGCEQDDAGDTMEDAADSVEDAGEDAGDAVEDATD